MDIQEWHQVHKCCPECNSKSVSQTLVGCVTVDGVYDDNINTASCKCGWQGMVKDLVKES